MSEPVNPYAAPADAPDGSLYVFEQGLFVVDSEKKIPGVCLKCARTENIARREERIAIGTAGAATGAVGGVIGASIASVARNDREMLLPMVAGALVVLGIVAFVTHQKTKRVELKLPLCDRCNETWTRGVMYRTSLLVGLGAIGVVLLIGWMLEESSLLAAGGFGFVAFLVVAFAARLPPRFITVQKALGTRLYLARVGSEVPYAIERRRAERAARKARMAAAREAEPDAEAEQG